MDLYLIIFFLGIKNVIYSTDTTLMAESEEELKSLQMNMKHEIEKAALKLKIQRN